MKRALVLGGGGAVGVAWEAAMVAGLLDGGVPLGDADLIIGTSAGSTVGATLAQGRDLRELWADQPDSDGAAANPAAGADPADIGAVFRLWGSFDEMTPERCAQVGALAVSAKAVPEDEWLARFALRAWDGWPSTPLLVCATDCTSGALVPFDAASGVPIELAIAASCAVPGLFAPVTIGGRRYTDGGVASWTSADLALRIKPDRVLLIAPSGIPGPGVRGLAAKQVVAETARLEAAGASVRLVTFDDAAAAHGANLMDAASRAPVAAAALAHAARIAFDLRAWWGA